MIVPSEFLKSEKWRSLSSSARSTLLCLAVYADKSGYCYPSINTIAEDMRNDRKTIILSIKELINIHMISKVQESGKLAKYTLNMSSEPVPNQLPVVKLVPVPNDTITSTVLTTTPVPNQLLEHTNNIPRTNQLDVFDSQKKVPEKKELINKKVISESLVEEIYSLYPGKDVNNQGRTTGKGSNDKKKIEKVLRSGYPLKNAIENYVRECARTKTYLKNFSVFLNNLPDEKEISEVPTLEDTRKAEYREFMERSMRAII